MASQPRRVLPRERDVLRAIMIMVSKVASPVIMTSSHAQRAPPRDSAYFSADTQGR
jgi:hypothetical protein